MHCSAKSEDQISVISVISGDIMEKWTVCVSILVD